MSIERGREMVVFFGELGFGVAIASTLAVVVAIIIDSVAALAISIGCFIAGALLYLAGCALLWLIDR